MKKIFLTVLMSGLLVSAYAQDEEGGEAAGLPEKYTVQITKAENKSNVFTQNLPGRVTAYRNAEVRSRVEGIVEKRVFEEGSFVEQGQVLFYIEKSQIQAQVNAAQANVENAEAAYELSLTTLERYKKLLKLGAVSKQEHDNYAAQTKQLKAQVSQAKAELDRNQVNLGYTTVTAPISGRIDKALVTEGALVTAGGSSLLAEIEQLDKVYIDFTRSESQGRQLEDALNTGNAKALQSKEVEIYFSDGQFAEKGVMEFISRKVDPNTGAVSLRATVNNPDQVLLPGMYVRVSIPVAEADNLIVVSQRALAFKDGQPFVRQIKEGKLVDVTVKTSGLLGSDAIITEGLSAGDEVVISDITVAKKMEQMGVPIVGEMAAPSANNTQSKE